MEDPDRQVQVVVAHSERATLRVGDVFLKIDGDPGRAGIEARAMELAPVPTPAVLWRRPPVLAIAAVPGAPIAVLGEPSTSSPAAWEAVGAAVRALHDAPLPPWPGRALAEIREELDRECAALLAEDVLPAEVIACNREIAEEALRPREPVFVHGDLQCAHVLMDGDEVAGIIDWSEAACGDPMADLAVLTLGHEEQLGSVLRGYGREADRGAIRGWWSLRSLTAARWLIAHGFDPSAPGCELSVLRARWAEASGGIRPGSDSP